MRRLLILCVLMSALLTACAGNPQSTPAPVAITDVPVITEIPASPQPTVTNAVQPEATVIDPPPTIEATPTVLSSTGLVEYQIDANESSVSYEVGETFFDQNNRFSVAVGVTTVVSGSIQLDPVNPQNTTLDTITVDISQFKSDSGRRDRTNSGSISRIPAFPDCHLCSYPDHGFT